MDTESLVPAEHLLRKIDAAVDFNKIYDCVFSCVIFPRSMSRLVNNCILCKNNEPEYS